MANLPFSPTTAALGLFKGIKAILVGLPIITAVPEPVLASQQPSVVQANSQTIQIDESVIEQAIQLLMQDIPKVTLLLDAATHLMPLIANELPEQEIIEFGQLLKKLDLVAQQIVQMSKNKAFTDDVSLFTEKVQVMYQSMLSERHKKLADEVVKARLYQNTDSVGYRFDSNHSFDDFKKAILG